ncbi:MAG TPA: hypothetical protein VFT22_07500 [Kofleriaceae bacterium]|nr:hypothetical protein [Kofleriaceae bacterium]
MTNTESAIARSIEIPDPPERAPIMSDDIVSLARDAGAAGRSWNAFCCDDAVHDYVTAHGGSDADLEKWRAAFDAGAVECLASQGWVSHWTTAPSDYDTFGTITAEQCGDWHGKSLRRVLSHPHHAGFQASRYGSGCHACWDEDPREEERRALDRAERWRRLDAERAVLRAEGLAWLASAMESEINEAMDRDEVESRGLTYAELGDEIRRRGAARVEAERAATWERCTSIVQPGMILVDDGEPSRHGRWGLIPGRDPHVYYDVRITDGWGKDADEATIVDARGNAAGSLSSVVDWIKSGRLRAVAPKDVPPEPVVHRLGLTVWRPLSEIRRIEVQGRPVWIGVPAGGFEVIALDERGHIVRGKRAKEAVAACHRTLGSRQ